MAIAGVWWGGGWQGAGVPDGGQPGTRLEVGAVRGQMGKMVAVEALGVGYQTGDGVPVRVGFHTRDGVLVIRQGSRQGAGYQTQDEVPDRE